MARTSSERSWEARNARAIAAHSFDQVRGHVAWFGTRAEPGIEPEVQRKLVIHARTSEKQDYLVAPALLLEKLDKGSSVFLVAIALRNHLAHEDRVRAKRFCAGKELLVLDLRAQVVDLESVVTLRPLSPAYPL